MGTKTDRLLLTPYIVDGNLSEAKELALVDLKLCPGVPGGDRPSYSGFLTVDERYGSNLFFWFFPTANNFDPVVLWLQGGPGNSSLFGLFCENGPVSIEPGTFQPVPRQHAWTKQHSMLYIDSPVGSGFSYTDNEKGYARTYAETATALYSALTQFFQLFPEYAAPANFYIGSESIGGKTALLLARKIHRENTRRPRIRINLKGVASFCSYIEPTSIAAVSADYFYSMGVFDEQDRDHYHAQFLKQKELKEQGKFVEAIMVNHELIRGDGFGGQTFFEKATGFRSNLNLLESDFDMNALSYLNYVQSDVVRKALHVGDIRFLHNGPQARKCLYGDGVTSEDGTCGELLDAGYQIMLTGAQFDVIVPYTAIRTLVDDILVWKGKEEWSTKKRTVWTVGGGKNVTGGAAAAQGQVAGYIKQHKNLVYVMMRNAGHIALAEQQEAGLDLITKFTRGARF